MGKSLNSLATFVLGIVTGITVGIMYAPDRGSSTRDKVTFLLDKYKNKLRELIDALVEGKDIHSSEAKSEGQKVVTDARIKAEQLLQDVDELIGQIKGKKQL